MDYVTGLDKCWHGRNSLEIAVLRTELVSDGGIGNKAYKLAPVIDAALSTEKTRIMSFGGAWSNHLHALAYRCFQHGVQSVGVVRSERSVDNVLLRSCAAYGMTLHFVSRSDYRMRDDATYCSRLCKQLGCDLWVPEGGSTDQAVEGCEQLGQLIVNSGFDPTVVVVPVGTGATFAGTIRQLPASVQAFGVPVVRDNKVHDHIQRWLTGHSGAAWQLTPVIPPRYGTVTEELLQFIVAFHAQTEIVLDPIYTGKVFKHCFSRGFTDQLPRDSRVLLMHTGGLLGGFGFQQQVSALPDSSAASAYLHALQRVSAMHIGQPGLLG